METFSNTFFCFLVLRLQSILQSNVFIRSCGTVYAPSSMGNTVPAQSENVNGNYTWLSDILKLVDPLPADIKL